MAIKKTHLRTTPLTWWPVCGAVRLDAFQAAGDLSSRMVVWYTLTAGIATCAALFIAWFIPSATGKSAVHTQCHW